VETASGDINFLMYGKAIANGTAPYSEELAEKPLSSARIYDSIYVRHWDVWLTPEKYTVWSGVLTKAKKGYTFDGTLKNLLAGVKEAETPVQPYGDAGDYDISPDGKNVIFLSKAPELPKANYTTSYIFLVPHDGSSIAAPINAQTGPNTPPNAQGASASPRFSPDGTQIAYFQMDEETYESDRNKLYIATIGGDITGVATDWDRNPDHLEWSPNGTSIYVAAPDTARERLFVIPTTAATDFVPKNITDEDSITTFHMLPDSSALVTSSQIWSPTNYYIASTSGIKPLFAANEADEVFSDLSSADMEEFFYEGNWTEVCLSLPHHSLEIC
jgi:dipeptidyl aminopeptidase/acylaminoacyl peptidase